MARTRVLFFTTRLGGGGAEMQLLHVANRLAREDLDVEVAVCRGGGEYEARLDPSILLHHLAPARVTSSIVGLITAARPLRRLVRERCPALVCAFMDLAILAALAAIPRSDGGPRLVGAVQNTLSAAYGASERRIARIVPPLARRLYPRLDRIIVLSRGAADDLVAMIPAVAPRVRVVHNAGFDDALAARAAAPLPGRDPDARRPLVVACGRLAPQKGYRYLLDAFVDVHRRTGAHLWILGDGPERSALEERIRKLRLDSAVELLGFQTNPLPFMAAADVFVLSSIYEGFGNVLVEAMATGRAVVSTDCPHGPREIITDGQDGLLVAPADAAALARALVQVLDDPQLRDRLGRAARRRAMDFHVDRSAAGYAAVFRELQAAEP